MNGLITALIIPFAGTVLGAAFVFHMRDRMKGNLQRTLLGFASGVMVAAAVWSLLIPSIEMQGGDGFMAVVPAAVGMLCGMGFLLLIDMIIPHLHPGDDAHPIFKFLKSRTKGVLGSAIKWNFTKFLISRDGEVIKRYAPTTAPEKLVKDIEEMLG